MRTRSCPHHPWLSALMAGALVGIPSKGAPAPPAVPGKPSPPTAGRGPALGPFLANPRLPGFIRDREAFRSAQEGLRTRLAQEGLRFAREDWEPWESRDMAPIPPEIRKVFCHPCCFWVRSGERWDAVVAVRNVRDELFLQRVLNVLKAPAPEAKVRVPFTTGGLLAAPWDDHRNALAHPVEMPFQGAWEMWDQYRVAKIYVGVLSGEPGATFLLSPELGIAQPTEGIRGEDDGELAPDDMPRFLLIPRRALAKAKVVRTDASKVWFLLEGRLRAADRQAWRKWQDPARPDLHPGSTAGRRRQD